MSEKEAKKIGEKYHADLEARIAAENKKKKSAGD